MGKIRVYELAKKLGLSNEKIIECLAKAGFSVKSHSGSVDEVAARAALSKAKGAKEKVPRKVARGEPTAKVKTAKTVKGAVKAKRTPELKEAAMPTPAPPKPAPAVGPKPKAVPAEEKPPKKEVSPELPPPREGGGGCQAASCSLGPQTRGQTRSPTEGKTYPG